MDVDIHVPIPVVAVASITAVPQLITAVPRRTLVVPRRHTTAAIQQSVQQQQQPQPQYIVEIPVDGPSTTSTTTATTAAQLMEDARPNDRLNSAQLMSLSTTQRISELYPVKRGNTVVAETDDTRCQWCGSAATRPCDADALQYMGWLYDALCDTCLCSPACLYSAACSQVPAERTDILQLVENALQMRYGPRIYRCDWCDGVVAALCNVDALQPIPELHATLAREKFCSPCCVYSSACARLPQDRSDIATIIYTALTTAYAQDIYYVDTARR
jgi:hypothetical protein